MSTVKHTGDQGTTGLMYNRRVPKNHPRVEACGAVDELNAALGLARALCKRRGVRATLRAIQQGLIILMGELAAEAADRGRYLRDGFPQVTTEMVEHLEQVARDLERTQPKVSGWSIPGKNASAAALHLARTVARRAERRVVALERAGRLANPQVLVYLNRLSTVLWFLARQQEAEAAKPA
jgi:cob(I)alamin adenosyltransferase